MAAEAFSHSGDKLYIASVAQNSDLDVSGFSALSWTLISGVGSVGERGTSTNTLTYDTWDSLVTQKAKGMTNAGDPQIELARSANDTGQVALRAAGAPDVYDNYAFKITKQDGQIEYMRGLVAGPSRPGGRNEDFDLENYTLMLNQLPVTDDTAVSP